MVSSTLETATLSINVTGTSTDTYEIYEMKRSWTELQSTWKKSNSATNWQSAGAQGSLDRGSTVLGTVTASATGILNVVLNAAGLAVVQGWVNNSATNFGFTVQDYANGTDDDLVFSSKEAAVAANRPQLKVVFNPPNMAAAASSGRTASALSVAAFGPAGSGMSTPSPTTTASKAAKPNSTQFVDNPRDKPAVATTATFDENRRHKLFSRDEATDLVIVGPIDQWLAPLEF